MARKKSTKVTNETVLQSALKARVRRVIVIGTDSHGRRYVTAAGRINSSAELADTIAQIAQAGQFLRRIRAKILRSEKAAKRAK